MGFLFNNSTPTGITFNGNSVTELRYNGTTVWTAVPDYSSMYLTFEALEDGTFSFRRNGTTADIYYSVDNGNTWTALASGSSTPTVTTGNKILWKSTSTSSSTVTDYNIFSSTGQFNVYGNIMSMEYGDNFAGQTSGYINFSHMFDGCTNIINAENLILPLTNVGTNGYDSMFKGCTNLITVPELPATSMGTAGYRNMFNGCTSLTKAPKLPMTTLSAQSYYQMFYGCTSLTTAPELPAPTLAQSCYLGMFEGCTNLNNVTMLATDISAANCLLDWVSGVAATGTFTKSVDMTTLPTGSSGIPSGWTVVDV